MRTIIEMVQRTRLDCVLGTAAGHASVGRRGGVARPRPRGVRRAPRRPAGDDRGARRSRARVRGGDAHRPAARAGVRGRTHPIADVALRRLATPVSKYWVTKRGPHHAYEALECLGGNGYTESFPLARRYREQPVMAIWEGSGNVIALDVLRALTRDPDSTAAFADGARHDHAARRRCWTRTSRARCAARRGRRRRARRRAVAGAAAQREARSGVPGVAHAAPRARRPTPRRSSQRAWARTARRSTACCRAGTDAAAIVARH